MKQILLDRVLAESESIRNRLVAFALCSALCHLKFPGESWSILPAPMPSHDGVFLSASSKKSEWFLSVQSRPE
jgi:hypothetical protein